MAEKESSSVRVFGVQGRFLPRRNNSTQTHTSWQLPYYASLATVVCSVYVGMHSRTQHAARRDTNETRSLLWVIILLMRDAVYEAQLHPEPRLACNTSATAGGVSVSATQAPLRVVNRGGCSLALLPPQA